LNTLPVVYKEMLIALRDIRDFVKLSDNVENIYDQCLFFNPKILSDNAVLE